MIGGKLKLRTRRPTAVTTQQSHDYTAKYHVLFGTGQSGPKFWQLLSVSLHERCSVVSRFNHSSDLNNSISDSRSISQNQKRADELDDLKAVSGYTITTCLSFTNLPRQIPMANPRHSPLRIRKTPKLFLCLHRPTSMED